MYFCSSSNADPVPLWNCISFILRSVKVLTTTLPHPCVCLVSGERAASPLRKRCALSSELNAAFLFGSQRHTAGLSGMQYGILEWFNICSSHSALIWMHCLLIVSGTTYYPESKTPAPFQLMWPWVCVCSRMAEHSQDLIDLICISHSERIMCCKFTYWQDLATAASFVNTKLTSLTVSPKTCCLKLSWDAQCVLSWGTEGVWGSCAYH